MKYTKILGILGAFCCSNLQAATLDELLILIQKDIEASRLSAPVGNNALEKIQTFRDQAPFDFRVVPLAYQWGDKYVDLANTAIINGNYRKAQTYLNRVWATAPLTQNLEEIQRKLNDGLSGQGKEALASQNRVTDIAKDDQARLAAQKQAELEKRRMQQQQAKQAAEAKRRAEEEAREVAQKKALAEKLRQQAQMESKKAAAVAVSSGSQGSAKQSVAAEDGIDEIDALIAGTLAPTQAGKGLAAVTVANIATNSVIKGGAATNQKAINKGVPNKLMDSKAGTASFIANAREQSDAIAEFDIPSEPLRARDRKITDQLAEACQNIVDEEASVVVHTASKSDYRWLAVRLTLCARRIDNGFRLRHSFMKTTEDKAFLTLHPSRDRALVSVAK